MSEVTGIISGDRLGGTVSSTAQLTGTVMSGVVRVPMYDGAYIIVPSTVGQVLDTSGKRLMYDLEVQAIATQRTTNEAGGYTVTIGV